MSQNQSHKITARLADSRIVRFEIALRHQTNRQTKQNCMQSWMKQTPSLTWADHGCLQERDALATRAAFRSHAFYSSFSPRMVGSARTNGSVKPSCRLNFNLHSEGFYYCCWFTGAKCLTSTGISRLLRCLFVPERSEARSKISSLLLRSASPENGTKGECKSCDFKTVQLGNACLRCGWQHAGSYSVPCSFLASVTLVGMIVLYWTRLYW